jgi:hypothetical protein
MLPALLRSAPHRQAAAWPLQLLAGAFQRLQQASTSASSGLAAATAAAGPVVAPADASTSTAAEPAAAPAAPLINSAFAAGQPTPVTHPELLAPHELTYGISSEEYAARRAKLVRFGQGHVPVGPHAWPKQCTSPVRRRACYRQGEWRYFQARLLHTWLA